MNENLHRQEEEEYHPVTAPSLSLREASTVLWSAGFDLHRSVTESPCPECEGSAVMSPSCLYKCINCGSRLLPIFLWWQNQSDVAADNRLSDGSVEGDQHLLGRVELSGLSQKVQPLLSLLLHRGDVGGWTTSGPWRLWFPREIPRPGLSRCIVKVQSCHCPVSRSACVCVCARQRQLVAPQPFLTLTPHHCVPAAEQGKGQPARL